MNNDLVKEFFDKKSLTWDERPVRPQEVYDEFAVRYFRLKEGDKAIDVGCGSGTFIPSIQKLTKTQVVGLDISPKMIDLAKPKFVGQDVVLYAEDFDDTKLSGFDVIICHNALSHLMDMKAFSDACARVVKPGGKVIISHFTDIDQINDHHKHCKNGVARLLDTAENESKAFLEHFDVYLTQDKPHYVISLVRK